MKKGKVDKALNIIIMALIIVIIVMGLLFFMRSSHQEQADQKNTVSRVEKKTSLKKHKPKIERPKQNSDENLNSSTSSLTAQGSNTSTQQSGNVQVNNAQGDNDNLTSDSPRSNGVIVDNGMNFSYRAAKAMGLIPNEDTENSVMDFYANCQDYDDYFVYNGKKYNKQVIQDGHENEYHCNILVTPAD